VIIRHDVIWDHLAPRASLLKSDAKSRFPETIELDKEILKEMERRFPNETSVYTSSQANDSSTHTIQYESLYDDDDVEDYSPPQEGPRTRAFYESHYWYAEMARANVLKASIFHDNTQSSINPHHPNQPRSDTSSDIYINYPGVSRRG
jgi:hypothetical protein